jgi:hypothetical protein
MPHNRLLSIIKNCKPKDRRNLGIPPKGLLDETRPGQQVAQLHDRYVVMIMMMKFCVGGVMPENDEPSL